MVSTINIAEQTTHDPQCTITPTTHNTRPTTRGAQRMTHDAQPKTHDRQPTMHDPGCMTHAWHTAQDPPCTVHDARPMTHNPRPTMHNPPTHPRQLVNLIFIIIIILFMPKWHMRPVLQGRVVRPAPNPQPGGPGYCFCLAPLPQTNPA